MVDVPANTTTTAVLETALLQETELYGTYSGRIETQGDHDWIRVNLTAGKTYSFYLSAEETGFPTGDSFLSLKNSAGVTLDSDDDDGVATNSYLSFTATTTGTHYIDVSLTSSGARGTYSVLMTDSLVGANAFQTDGHDIVTAGGLQWLVGGPGNDRLDLGTQGYAALGEQGDDLLFGTPFSDPLSGGLGNDQVLGLAGDDLIFGDAGDDQLSGLDGDDQVFGGDGFDDLFGGAHNDRLFGGADDDLLFGGTENDLLNGGSGDDTLNGDDGTDTLNGSTGNDTLRGGVGNDVLTGGAGRDRLFGDADRDIFDFNSKSETVKGGSRDQILHFQRGTDDIDLGTIDARSGVSGNNAFKFIGKKDFSDVKGELRYEDKGATVIVQGDINGDGKADFEIFVAVGALGKGDFIL